MRAISLLLLTCAALAATPARATGGYLCRTADGSGLEIAVGFGHVPGAPLIGARLRVKERAVPVEAPQWWLDDKEMRLLLTDPQSLDRLTILTARRNGRTYDGSVFWGGKRRWVRCTEN